MLPSNSGTIERYATPKVEGAGGNCVCLATAHAEKAKARELYTNFSVLALVLSDFNFKSSIRQKRSTHSCKGSREI